MYFAASSASYGRDQILEGALPRHVFGNASLGAGKHVAFGVGDAESDRTDLRAFSPDVASHLVAR